MLERIGRYEIKGILGEGGFGKVYLGFDQEVGRNVAIKVLASRDDNLLSRFRTEATAAGNLKHENIVTVYEFGRDGDMYFMAMEYLEGKDLQRVLQGAQALTLTLARKMRVMSQVAEGLMYAHQNGYVHRDVKPANIMLLNDGSVKIMDFGIARLIREEATRLTQSGYMVGTPSYMSPEQLKLGESGISGDVWAFGTIYYELVTGQHPFSPTDPDSTMYRICNTTPSRVRSLCAECLEVLDDVIGRLLAKDPASRLSLQEACLETEGLLIDLESKQARVLATQARELINRGNFEEADHLLGQVLELDPRHQEARTLRKETQKGMRQRSLRSQVQAMIDRSESEVAKRNFAEATHAVESALRLDPADPRLPARLKELRALKHNSEVAQERLTQALDEFQQNNLTAAFQKVSEALRAEPANTKGQRLLAEVQRRMADRDKDRRLRDGITKAKGLVALQDYDNAVALLKQLEAQAPESQAVRDLLEQTVRQREAHEREHRIRLEVDAAKAAIKGGDMDAAIVRLEPLLALVSGFQQAELKELLDYARQERESRDRAAKVKALGNEAWAFLKAKQFEQALRSVDECLQYSPQDGLILKLRETVLAARVEEEQRTIIERALAESAALERSDRVEQAMVPLEKALRDFPEAAGLQDALDRLKRKAEEQQRARVLALEQELERARQSLDAGDLTSATRLLKAMAASYPGEAPVNQLLDRAQSEQNRRAELKALCAEIRRYLDSGKLEQADEAVARGRARFAVDAEFARLDAETAHALARRDELDRANRAVRERNWPVAEDVLNSILARDANDAEAHGLLARVRRERDSEQRRTLLDRGRQEVSGLLQSSRFDEAIRQLQALHREFPDQTVLREDLTAALDAKERHILREAYAKGRQQADGLVKQGLFDSAITVLQKLLMQFPEDAALQNDLRAATEAKKDHDARQHIARERRKAKDFIQERKFGDAIQVLQGLSGEFQRDTMLNEDLALAISAKALQEQREELDRQFEQLEKLYRRGDAQAVKERAGPLASQDPRIRELLDWAETEIARQAEEKARESAETLRARRRRRFVAVLGSGAFVVAAILGGIFWSLRPTPSPISDRPKELPPAGPAPSLSASPAQLTFDFQPGAPAATREVTLKSSGSVNWTATATDNWLRVTPLSGQVPAQVSISVDPARLAPGTYSAQVVFAAAGGNAAVGTNVKVRIAAPAVPPPPPKGAPPAPAPVSKPQAPTISSFSVEPRTIERGQSATLNWSASGATELSLDQNIGAIPATGARQVSPAATTNYTLTARGPGGTTNRMLTLEVTAPPQPQPPPSPRYVAPPPVNCQATEYTGRKSGSLRWNGAVLPPDGELVFGGPDERLAGGKAGGQSLPGCDVTLTPGTTGIVIEDPPSRADGFRRLKIRNASKGPLSSVEIRWSVK